VKYSLATLGSKYVEERVMEDIEELYEVAESNQFQPIILSVGPLFLDICSVHSIISELQIQNWIEELEQNRLIIAEMVNTRISQYYIQCEAADGIFDVDEARKVVLYFDPDDPYITLICKVEEDDDGAMLRSLKLKEEEILPEIQNIIKNQ
jgi:hypothetical protein